MAQLKFSQWSTTTARFPVLLLHDHRERLPDAADPWVRAFLDRRCEVFAPFGGSTWWLDRIDPTFDPVQSAERAVVEWLASRTGPVAAVGGEAAVRLGFRHPNLLRVVAGWDCAFDFHELLGRGTSLDRHFERREQARQHTTILQLRAGEPPPAVWFGCSSESDFFRGHDRLHEKLAAVGVPHEFVVADECPVEAMADFVFAGLERQSRRLL